MQEEQPRSKLGALVEGERPKSRPGAREEERLRSRPEAEEEAQRSSWAAWKMAREEREWGESPRESTWEEQE